MKKKLIYIAIPVLLASFAFGLISTQTSQKAEEKHPVVLSMTKSVDVPDKIEFAGEELALDRYDFHERFDREINSFIYWHSTTMMLIKKANRYFPIIVPILKENGVPEDFKYLAVIESNLNHRAVSPAGAAGLWQFMKTTAPGYGLTVSSEVDERYSVEKSTQAACKYFLEAYEKYGSWADVALSYNAGQGRITTEKSKQKADSGLDLWVVDETSRYYFRMLAAKTVMENPYKYGFVIESHQLYKPMEFEKVEVKETIADLAAFAKEKGVTYAQLKDFNSWLRDRKLTITEKNKGKYTILIPTKQSLYYKKGDKINVYDNRWVTRD